MELELKPLYMHNKLSMNQHHTLSHSPSGLHRTYVAVRRRHATVSGGVAILPSFVDLNAVL